MEDKKYCGKPSLEEVVKKLRASGYKLTYTRLEVVRIMIERGEEHPSLVEIYEEAKKRIPTVSFTTVYNTARLLESLGVLWLFEYEGDKRVELVTKPHVNIVDREKNTIMDFCDLEALEYLEKALERLVEKTGRRYKKAVFNVVV